MMNPGPPRNSDTRRALPAVDRLVRELAQQRPDLPGWAVTAAARTTLAEARAALDGGAAVPPATHELLDRAVRHAATLSQPCPRRVVNATGVVLHTNLGRAVLAPGAAQAVAEAASGYSDLELDVESGRRGDRLAALSALLVQLGGCEAALAVNNNAAATMLALDTLARGREVIVSRGELVEIGGSFRVPDILERAGVRLVEVGTTNRTHADDYRRAIGPDTALLLKVHRSNFELRGFTAEVDLPALVAIGRERGVPVVEDLGSASLLDLSAHGLPPEAYAPARAATGVDCLCFSGDKLLGGPQAGLVLGRREVVEAMRRNPLARALRLDKLSLAALDWTLRALLEGREQEIPTVRQLTEPAAQVRRRAEALADRLRKLDAGPLQVEVENDRSAVGGGTLPEFELETSVVALRGARRAETLAAALRRAPTPVLSRIRDDAILLDPRTLLEGDDVLVEGALANALREGVV
jgi:L-seryl-tRNA(Ser) seleniumtransferase